MHFGSEQAVNYGDGLPMALLCGVAPRSVDVKDFSKAAGLKSEFGIAGRARKGDNVADVF